MNDSSVFKATSSESLPLRVGTLTAKLPETLRENFTAVYLPVMVTHVTITARENETIPLRLNRTPPREYYTA